MIDLSNYDLSKLSYSEKAELLSLLEEKERRQDIGGHLVKIWPDDGPLSWKHYHKHMRFFEATNRHSEVYFSAANRCLAEGTLIATPKGPTAIENLNVGDYVYDRYGKPTKVIATWDNGEAETVSMQNRGKEYLRCTPNHELDVLMPRYRNARIKFDPDSFTEGRCEAGQVCSGTKVRREYVDSPLGYTEFPAAYALGALLGDGCCLEKGNYIAVSSQDNKVPERVRECLDGDYIKWPHKSNYTWYIRAEPPEHYSEWCAGRYAHEKTVDLEVIKTWDRESILGFVAGLLDTDGSLNKSKDGYTMSLSMQAKPVIDAFAWCVLALWQEQVTLRVDNRDKYVNGPVHSAIIRNPWAVWRICEELQPYVQHKYKCDLGNFDNVGKRSFPTCIKLTPKAGKVVRVYDITVAHPEHMYLLANGISVSNCGKSIAGAYATACHLTGSYPHWWPGRKFDKPINAWACGDTSQTTRDIVQKELLGPPGEEGTGMIAKDAIIDIRRKPGVPGAIESARIRSENGGTSYIGFKSYDQGRRSFQGTAMDWIWADEEIPADVYGECVMRLMTTNGVIIITATPIKGLTTFVQSFLDEAERDEVDYKL